MIASSSALAQYGPFGVCNGAGSDYIDAYGSGDPGPIKERIRIRGVLRVQRLDWLFAASVAVCRESIKICGGWG
jgi:hypothetical protein